MTAFPPGLPLELDRSVHVFGGGRVLVGGDPPRALRLAPAGPAVLIRLQTTGAGRSAAAARLARILVDGGLAHPRPAPVAAADVTVVVPVRDRADDLDRCLSVAGAPVLVVDDGSRDAATVAAVCARHRARLLRLPVSGGPAAARNAALEHVTTPIVAFLDSDCVPPPDWIAALAGHFEDPLVVAVAPRVVGFARRGDGPVGRYAAARSPLDLGRHPARVTPGSRVSYVPTAALLVRREALGEGFDPALRYGEDVDLVWRLHDAGWRVRYDPSVEVRHREPMRWRHLVGRRFHYGSSAAPLAARHPSRLAPMVVHPWPTAVVGLALCGRPRAAALAAVGQTLGLARRFRGAGVPVRTAPQWVARGSGQTLLALSRGATMFAAPALLAALLHPRGRRPAIVLLVAAPGSAWLARRPSVDPVRWTLLHVLDDIAYGTGVWTGCARQRTLAPVRPTGG